MGWSLAWVLLVLVGVGIEGAGIFLNEKYDRDDDPTTTREKRTATENLRWLFATDKDSARARYRGLRRFAMLGIGLWLVVHVAVPGWV